jgi:hypothetical protein
VCNTHRSSGIALSLPWGKYKCLDGASLKPQEHSVQSSIKNANQSNEQVYRFFQNREKKNSEHTLIVLGIQEEDQHYLKHYSITPSLNVFPSFWCGGVKR